MHSYQAVLFDFDGVLGLTHEDNLEAWRHAFSSYGLSFDEEEYLLLEGKRSTDIVSQLIRASSADQSLVPELIDCKNRYYAEHNSFALYPGVRELIDDLRKCGLKLALVSGGSSARLRKEPCDKFLPMFDVVLTSDDCKRCKPDPDPYLSAAEMLGVQPEDCLVIENAPLGIQAAKSAGMDCVAISSTLKSTHLLEADIVMEDIRSLHNRMNPSESGVLKVPILRQRACTSAR